MHEDDRINGYSAEVAAERAGVDVADVAHLSELGILFGEDGYTDADVRRIYVVRQLERDGLDVDSLARLVREGRFSLEFIDQAGYGVFAALGDETFGEVSARTGIPVEQLAAVREITTGTPAKAEDRVREDELRILPLVEYQVQLGFRWSSVERALRVYGDSLRRIAEAEAEWWRSEVQDPMVSSGRPVDDYARMAAEVSPKMSLLSDDALAAMYHAQQMQVWLRNLADGVEAALEQAGMHVREERVPAMCFLDLVGFTELTEQQGDAAAADLVERLNRIVQRISFEHGGRPIKWLGDGVMFFFPDPPLGVAAALAMVDALSDAGLPAAHIGLHAGSVVVQQGDFYGRTVNLAARIGDYARSNEVLVSQSVVDACLGAPLEFTSIGRVELKGVAERVELFMASGRSGAAA